MFSKIAITHTEWTLIGNNVNPITFQNVGQQQIYVIATTSNSQPSETVGPVYDIFQGELLVNPADMSLSAGTFLWAKTVTGNGYVIVETP